MNRVAGAHPIPLEPGQCLARWHPKHRCVWPTAQRPLWLVHFCPKDLPRSNSCPRLMFPWGPQLCYSNFLPLSLCIAYLACLHNSRSTTSPTRRKVCSRKHCRDCFPFFHHFISNYGFVGNMGKLDPRAKHDACLNNLNTFAGLNNLNTFFFFLPWTRSFVLMQPSLPEQEALPALTWFSSSGSHTSLCWAFQITWLGHIR